MKILVCFDPNKKHDNFEGSRLRKTIKGALEIAQIDYTSDVLDDDYDIVHLISYDDFDLQEDAIDNNKSVVVSALSCENDNYANYFQFDYKDGQIKNVLSNKAIKFLNNANVVLVPTESAKRLLIKNDITSKIKVVLPGVNISRFDSNHDVEKELFYRYFREDKTKKLVVAIGNYDYLDGISAFINAAKNCPDAIFYFFGQASSTLSVKNQIKQLEKNSPKNIHFKDVVPDDIYRSALMNASIFMVPCYHYCGVISLLEAMAAKCELIIREQEILDGFIIDGVSGHVAKFSETLVELCKECLAGKIKSTIPDAYQLAIDASLKNTSERLKSIYEEETKLGFYLRREKND